MKRTGSGWNKTFKEAFCHRYGYPLHQYESAVFWRCLYLHALPIAFLLHRWKPQFFAEDFDFINEIGKIADPDLFRNELNFFYGRNRRDRNWIRRSFAIRVSARRLVRLKNRVFSNPLFGMAITR